MGDAGVLQYQDADGDEEEEEDFEIMPDGSVRMKGKGESDANGDRHGGPPQLPEIELGDDKPTARTSEERGGAGWRWGEGAWYVFFRGLR